MFKIHALYKQLLLIISLLAKEVGKKVLNITYFFGDRFLGKVCNLQNVGIKLTQRRQDAKLFLATLRLGVRFKQLFTRIRIGETLKFLTIACIVSNYCQSYTPYTHQYKPAFPTPIETFIILCSVSFLVSGSASSSASTGSSTCCACSGRGGETTRTTATASSAICGETARTTATTSSAICGRTVGTSITPSDTSISGSATNSRSSARN